MVFPKAPQPMAVYIHFYLLLLFQYTAFPQNHMPVKTMWTTIFRVRFQLSTQPRCVSVCMCVVEIMGGFGLVHWRSRISRTVSTVCRQLVHNEEHLMRLESVWRRTREKSLRTPQSDLVTLVTAHWCGRSWLTRIQQRNKPKLYAETNSWESRKNISTHSYAHSYAHTADVWCAKNI